MPRPNDISNIDLNRWELIIKNDQTLPDLFKVNLDLKEVCFAGLWLSEQLKKYSVNDDMIQYVLYEMGQLSFGNDPWMIHTTFLEKFKKNISGAPHLTLIKK